MNIYEFYNAEIQKLEEERAAREKAEAEARAKMKEELKELLFSCLKALLNWGMEIMENMPEESYDSLKRMIADVFNEEYSSSDLYLEINPYSLGWGIDCYYRDFFDPKEDFSNSDYTKFKETTKYALGISIYPALPNLAQINIYDEDGNFVSDLSEKFMLLEEILLDCSTKTSGDVSSYRADIDLKLINS